MVASDHRLAPCKCISSAVIASVLWLAFLEYPLCAMQSNQSGLFSLVDRQDEPAVQVPFQTVSLHSNVSHPYATLVAHSPLALTVSSCHEDSDEMNGQSAGDTTTRILTAQLPQPPERHKLCLLVALCLEPLV